jgi:SAM-dependent methyltransferase
VIDGRLELETRLRNAFEEDRVDDADIIIGKKAFHEVQPATQRLLLQECAENLRPGGRLVVYADSPPFMGPQRMYDFETCRNNLMRATKELSSAGPEERDSIISVLRHYFLEEITLGPNDHDYGFFANLWVMLKDWCNDNGNELENRYFSSHTEIQDWAETLPSGRPTGLRLLNPNPQQYYYHLFAERFNERAINRLFEYIDGIRPNTPDPAVLDDLWRPSDMYELFRDFTATHLWPEGKKSAFGAHAGAVKDTVSLADFDKTLARFDFDAVGFKFPVHVLEFEKT